MQSRRDDLARRLRARRLERGKSLDALRAETRIPRAALLALEEGRFEALPGGPVTKGFALAYARAVGVDPNDVHACFPAAAVSTARASAIGPPPLRATWRWVVLLALLLVPLWLLGRWLSQDAPHDLGEAGQARFGVAFEHRAA